MDTMRRSLGVAALVAAAVLTVGPVSVYAADEMSGQAGSLQSDIIKAGGAQQKPDSELGLGKSQDENFGGMPKEERRQMESGPMGEENKGGTGPSGPKGVPPGPAPQFEGSGQHTPGQSPTGGP
jgi:hypothetical protein